MALSKGEAKAYRKTYENNVLSNIEELTNIEVNANQLAAIQSAPKQGGIYELEYAVKENNKEVFKTVNVIVKGVSTSIDNNLVLTASGFSLENAEASSIDQAQAILKGNAKAMLASTGEVVTTVMVDASELQTISQTGENGGIYNLTYTANSGTMQTSVTVKVVVLGVGTPPLVETEDNDRLAISAHGFVLENKDAKFLTENKAKTNSEVYAWLVKAQEEVTDITVDAKQLKAIQTAPVKGGVYDLTLTGQSGVIKNAITIKVFVKPAGSVTDSSDTYTIDANGFVISYEDSKNIDDTKAKQMSSSIAYKVIRDTSGVILNIVEVSNEIIVDQTQLSDINNASTSGGIFALGLSVGDQNNVVSIEVPVLIVPKWSQSSGEITIGAEGFVLENADARLLTESLSLNKANAKAYKIMQDADGNVISLEDLTSSIKVNETELKAIQGATQNGGVYDLTYSVSDQKGVTVSKTVKVIVKGTHTPVPDGESDQLAMTASDFTIENTEASGLTVEKVIEKSKAEAWLIKEGSLVEVFVDEKELTEIQKTTSKGGVYPLTLRATYKRDGELIKTELTIQVTINAKEGDVLGENIHNQGDLNETTKVNNEVIQTSDTTNFLFYIMLLIVSISSIKLRKRKES